MTKANANAAANAQEQQAAQQQILRDLLALGKKNGRLTLKEISDALSHLELSSEDIDKVYETLETMGIEVETNGVLEKVIGDDDDSFEPEEVEEVPEEELVDTSAMAETFAIDDPVRMYLKEIGKVDLLSPEEEVTLAERMQKGNEAAERIANEGDAIPAEERAQLEKDIKLGDRAKKRLAEANLRLVVSIAKRYVGRGMLFLDLIQAQATQINERADALPAQTQPAASAQDRATAFPVEFQCLLQCGRTHISLCCKQSSISPLF